MVRTSLISLLEDRTAEPMLTDISECLNATLDVGLLRRDDPVAVVEPEGGLQQLDEDGLVCLWREQRQQAPL